MNDKSKTKKTAFAMSEEEFQQILQEQERSEPFDDKALEKFVRKPKELSLYDKFISVTNFFLLFFLLYVICACSIISSIKGCMEPFVAVPIAFLCMIGIVVLAQ